MSKTEDVVTAILNFVNHKLDEGDMAELRDMLIARHGLSHELVSPDAYLEMERSGANDRLARDGAGGSAVREAQLIDVAKRECAPYLDNAPLAFDSAASVYRAGLRGMGVDAATVRETQPAALRGFYNKMRELKAGGGQGLAHDSAPRTAAAARFLKDFPDAVLPSVRAA